MGFPMAWACSRGRTKNEDPVAVSTQARHAAFALRGRRLRGDFADRREFLGFCVEIDDGGRLAVHAPLRSLAASRAPGSGENLAPRFDCGDLHFWRPLERFRGTSR